MALNEGAHLWAALRHRVQSPFTRFSSDDRCAIAGAKTSRRDAWVTGLDQYEGTWGVLVGFAKGTMPRM